MGSRAQQETVDSTIDAEEKFRGIAESGSEIIRTVLDSIESGILVIDPETRKILDANAATIEMFGAAKDQILGSICHKFVCKAEKEHCPILDLGQHVDHSERVLVKANGETLPIIKTVVPVMLGDRKLLIESFVDISEHKKMEELQGSPNAIFTTDLSGQITYFSPAAEKFGYRPEEPLPSDKL